MFWWSATIFFVGTGNKWIGKFPAMRKPAIIPDRVTDLRKERGLSQQQLADKLGVKQQTIQMIEGGKVAKPTILTELARELMVDPRYLLGENDERLGAVYVPREDTGPAMVRIPDLAIFGGMGGGGMLEVLQDESGALIDGDQLRGYWTFPDYMVSAFRNLRKIYAWEVRGDSMEPTLAGGSVVFVDMAQDRLPPDDIYAIDYGDGLMVKRLKLIPRSDRVAVISDNEHYGTDELLREEVHVYGRIVGWFQWRK